MREKLTEPNCSDGWDSYIDEVDGECPDCGTPTVDGTAAYGCFWSPVGCKTCAYSPCDGSC